MYGVGVEVKPTVPTSTVEPEGTLASALTRVELDGDTLAEEHGRGRPPGYHSVDKKTE